MFNQTFNNNWTSFDDSYDNETFNNRHKHWGYVKNLTYENDEEKISMNKKTKEQWKILSRMYPPTVTTVQTSDELFCESPSNFLNLLPNTVFLTNFFFQTKNIHILWFRELT